VSLARCERVARQTRFPRDEAERLSAANLDPSVDDKEGDSALEFVVASLWDAYSGC